MRISARLARPAGRRADLRLRRLLRCSGFPLDDVWHRLFGQDVTLWGPTHLMLIGGAVDDAHRDRRAAGRGSARERCGRAAGREPRLGHEPARGSAHRRPAARPLDLPGRVRLRRPAVPLRLPADADHARRRRRRWSRPRACGSGAARRSARSASSSSIRGALALLVGPVLGETTPHFPLYLVRGADGRGGRPARSRATRPLRVRRCGRGVGDRDRRPGGRVGLVARVDAASVARRAVPRGARSSASPSPWPARWSAPGSARACVEPMPPTACAAHARRGRRRRRSPSLVGFALYKPADEGVRADVALTDDRAPGAGRAPCTPTVTLDPRDAADDAEWLTATAWQGGGLVVDRLERGRPRALPDHRADPGARQLEGADPPARTATR